MHPSFSYAGEKLSTARRILMLPHPRGEAESLRSAFVECDLGLKNVPRSELDENARSWLDTIMGAMDTTGAKDQSDGLWIVKAASMTIDEKIAFSKAVDELIWWFDSQ